MSQILKNAITGTYPNFAINYSMVQLSQGPLAVPSNPSAKVSTSGFTITWTDNSAYDDSSNPDDNLMPLLYNVDKNEAYYLTTSSAKRSEATLTITLPTTWAGDTIHAYIAARTADGIDPRRVSDTTYLGQYTAI